MTAAPGLHTASLPSPWFAESDREPEARDLFLIAEDFLISRFSRRNSDSRRFTVPRSEVLPFFDNTVREQDTDTIHNLC